MACTTTPNCCWGFCPAWFPQSLSPKEITQRSTLTINYKLHITIKPISSGFLLTLITYINLLFLIYFSHVAGYLFQLGSYILLLLWQGHNCRRMGFPLPRILLFSVTRLYFLSGCPTYTSCLATDRSAFI